MADLDIKTANKTFIDVRLSRSGFSPSSNNPSVLAEGLYRRKRLPVTHYTINADALPKNKLKNKKLSHVKDSIYKMAMATQQSPSKRGVDTAA